MTATYNPALLSNLDKVRFDTGDTDVANAVIQDETISALLAEDGATRFSVSAAVAQAIYSAYQHRVTYDVDGQGERYSDLAKNYAATVALLNSRALAALAAGADEETIAASQAIGGGIMVGGLSRSENIDRANDPDRAANFSPRYTPCPPYRD